MDETLNKIISLLKERNIAKGKFLKDLGFNKSAIAGWENGEHASYRKKLPEIASYFDVSLDWLAGNEQKEKPAAINDELDPKSREIIDKLKMLNPGNRSAALALIDSLIKNQDKK